MSTPTTAPISVFFDTSGKPLENGKLYFGTAGLNPETNAVTVYWDSAGTIPAAQPIRTTGGYPYRNGSPAIVYVDADYSLTVRDANDVLVYNVANAAGTGLASAITFTASGAGAVTRTLESKLRDFVSVLDYGADNTGAADARAAIQAAIDAVDTAGGGDIYFPPGTYLINSTSGPDGVDDGLIVPYNAVQSTANKIRIWGAGTSSVLKAGSNNMNIIRFAGNNGSVENLAFDGNAKTSIVGLACIPEDTTQTTTVVYQMYNVFRNLYFDDMAEGINFRTGPDVGGTNSECSSNTVDHCRFHDVVRGIWFRDCPSGSSGSDNNSITNCYFTTPVMNVGVDIGDGYGNVIMNCKFIDIATGTSPVNPATAISVNSTGTSGDACDRNKVIACYFSAGCNRSITSINTTLECYGNSYDTVRPTWTSVPDIQIGDRDASVQYIAGLKYNDHASTTYDSVLPQSLYLPNSKLQFPSSPSYSTDANVIDSYVEGSWTPTISGGLTGGTINDDDCFYVKVGQSVVFTAHIDLATDWTKTASQIQISLPVAPKASILLPHCVATVTGLTGRTAGEYVLGLINSTSSAVFLEFWDQDGYSAIVSGNDCLTNGPTITLSGCYRASQ